MLHSQYSPHVWPHCFQSVAATPKSDSSTVAEQEAAALSEAQASNQLLRTQLVEATSAFHHALSIAQTLLTEGACPHMCWPQPLAFGVVLQRTVYP